MSEGSLLIVDDTPTNLTLLAGILQAAGYDVRAANSGARALQSVARELPELILLDIQMPEMDGYEVCHRLKSDPATEHIPVIFISALDSVGDKVRGFDVGAVDYVTKPFEAAEVLARVGTQLKVSRLQRELEQRNAELERKNEELLRANQKTVRVFTALSDVLPGTVLDDTYRIDAKIGEGGFGAVFRGFHLALNRPVAIKVLRPSAANANAGIDARFRIEGIAACRVSHPNAVEVLDFRTTTSGIAYLVMELLRGYTLGFELKERGPRPLARCVEVIVPVCEALEAAHLASILHRDVKPENVFLHQTRTGEIVKVVDFGIAKLMDEPPSPDLMNLTAVGELVGTPDYIAPERILGEKCDGRSDVYSVGVMLYMMLAGRMPFPRQRDHGPYASAIKRLTTEPEPLSKIAPDIPAEADALVLQAMSRDALARPTAREFAAALSRIALEPEADCG